MTSVQSVSWLHLCHIQPINQYRLVHDSFQA